MNPCLLSKSIGCLHKHFLNGNMHLTCSVIPNIRRFSNEKDNDSSETNEIYVPRRIRKRLEIRKLSLKDVEQRTNHHCEAVHSANQFKRGKFKGFKTSDELQKALHEAKVGDFDQPEFPSDSKRSSWKSQVNKAYRQGIDPKETTILLFPGQGSQFVGMGEKLLHYPRVCEMYETASNILGYDLLHLCLHGPEKDLKKTVYCQPAVMVTSLAAMEKLKEEHPQALDSCVGTAGFSVGEFAALVVAGALKFDDAVKLIKHRAQYMNEAAEEIPGGMMSVFITRSSELTKAMEAAREYCKSRLGIEQPICSVANYLCTDCKVLAGNIEALQFIEQYKKHFRLLRTKWLPVSGAFHTSMMKASAAPLKFRRILDTVDIQDPQIAVHSNIDGKPYKDAYAIRNQLPTSIAKAVAWEQTIHRIYQRPAELALPGSFGVGPGGGQLGMLLRLTNAKAYKSYKAINV